MALVLLPSVGAAEHFSSIRIESFHAAEYLQTAVLTLNAKQLLLYCGRESSDCESVSPRKVSTPGAMIIEAWPLP